MVTVSVVVITYKRTHTIAKCLNSLAKQTYRDFEVIVVGDMLDSATKKKLEGFRKKFGKLKLICNDRRVLQPTARNIGIDNAKGSVVAFVDDDVIAEPFWLEELLKGYTDEKVAGVGGGCPHHSLRGEKREGELPKQLGLIKDGVIHGSFEVYNNSTEPVKVAHLRGCNMSFRKSTLKEVGGFSTAFFRGNAFREETDICIRLRERGYELRFIPKARVWHMESQKGGARTPGYYFYTAYNEFMFLRSHNLVPMDERLLNFIYWESRYALEYIKNRFDYNWRMMYKQRPLKEIKQLTEDLVREFRD
jgi:GT2 family glycosyltransferase